MIPKSSFGRLVGIARHNIPFVAGNPWRALSTHTALIRSLQASSAPDNAGAQTARTSQWSGKTKLAALLGAAAFGSSTCTDMKYPVMCEEANSSADKPEKTYTLTEKCVAEAVGTGIIVLGGCGAVAANVYCGSGLAIGAAGIAWGSSVALAAYSTRDISGAHLNPAVTAAVAVNKDHPKSEVLPYWLAQMVGATVAGAINFVIFSAAIFAHEAKTGIKRGAVGSAATFAGPFGMIPNAAYTTAAGAFAIEVFATAMLLFCIFAITDPNSTVPDGAGPALVGLTVATIITMIAPLTQAGLNPARDLGPRLVTAYVGWGSVAWTDWWVYTLGPLLGGVLGGAFYRVTCEK